MSTRAEIRAARDTRAELMAVLYRDGKTLEEIGSQYGLTRERVRQLLANIGVTKKDGGAHIKGVRSMAVRHAKRDSRHQAKNGMTFAEYVAARANLAPSGQSATRAFWEQRRNMRNRGYKWTLKFAEWWSVWQESGRWDQRARGGSGYWLVRKNNSGAYASGNVEVVHGADFVSFVRDTERASGRGIGRARSRVTSQPTP